MEKIIGIDTETTGLDPMTDELLQVSIVDSDGIVLFDEYMCPKTRSWEAAESINHITYDMVKQCPPIEKYAEEIQKILSEADTIVGYNTEFDLGFIRQAGIELRPETNIVDVMEEFRFIYGEWSEKYQTYKRKKLSVCAEYYGYDWGDTSMHNSLADAKATMYCYHKIREARICTHKERRDFELGT